MLELNALDVIDCRKIDFIPQHFAKVKINDNDYHNDKIESWIRNRLKHRYAVCMMPSIDEQNRLKCFAYAAFESQKELTYFMLACPHLRRL